MKKESDVTIGGRNAVQEVSFSVIKHAVAKQFELMKGNQLFRISLGKDEAGNDATKDLLWNTYISSFPAGTNPVFKERTDHDCQCCKSFVRQMGGVVAIIDGRIRSIWDVPMTGSFYDAVSHEMAVLVKSAPIDNVFFHTEKQIGVEKNFQQVLNGVALAGNVSEKDALKDLATHPFRTEGGVITWEHFHLHLPMACTVDGKKIGPLQSEARAAHDVLKRGLTELTLDAVDTVLELIAQNSLYRGEEHKGALMEFRRLKVAFDAERCVTPFDHATGKFVEGSTELFVWSNIGSFAARIRNTAIGTLLIDLSDDVDLEDAVKKFEGSIMAPANYKRPTALVSKAMVQKAQAKIEELGLTSALERRYATIDDITVNNILFVDRAVRPSMSKLFGAPYGKGKQFSGTDAFADILSKVPENTKKLDKVEEVTIEDFLANIVPKAESLELLVENRHAGNLVSLIAPVDPGSKNLFKWSNRFSWSYAGEMADSIKERVKKAGGSVTGDLCCRLAWDYVDDLDFHMYEPTGGHVSFRDVRRLSKNGGMLDVDANGCDGMKADPVENIYYAEKRRMHDGVYSLVVNNYSRRSNGTGFEAEVEFGGVQYNFVYEKALRTDETVKVADITYSKVDGFSIKALLPSTQASKQVWGMQTETFRKVNVVMLSPNYWDLGAGASTQLGSYGVYGVGNKHYFFMLDGCHNEDKARGFFNEFLSNELEPHRKTMEMVGSKMRTEESERQLSGLGFSSTQRGSVLVRVKGSFQRVVKVAF